jgi:large subunit ribosomal protein L22
MEAVQKQRRSVIKRNKKEAAKAEKGNSAVAKLNDVPSSTRKMRLVADLIRGERVTKALNVLKYQPKHGARKLEKLLLSAIANWQNANENNNIEEADLYVKEIFVDGGRMLKRLRPAPQGRAFRVRKRSNHVTLVIDTLSEIGIVAEPAPKKSAPKNEKPESKSTGEKNEAKAKKTTSKTSKTDKE